jgi:hypothetical protein
VARILEFTNRIEIAGNLKAFFENNFNGNEYMAKVE